LLSFVSGLNCAGSKSTSAGLAAMSETINLWLLFWAALGVAYALTAVALAALTYGAIALTAATARWTIEHLVPNWATERPPTSGMP
jgi:hypothetical protein